MTSTEEIKKVFDVVAEKFPSEINAFATYVQDRESADDETLRKVESILK